MKRVYLDACVVIDLIEGTAENQAFLSAELGGKWVVGSELLRMEARIKALREERLEFLDGYNAFFAHCELVELDRAVFECATGLRVQHRIKTPDALHLAAALHASCDEFWSSDRRLLAAAEGKIAIIDWDSFKKPV